MVALAACIMAVVAPQTTGSAFAQASAPAARSAGDPPIARVVAVMPFANVSTNPADDWIGFGIAETVLTDLKQLGLPTVGREAFAGPARPSDVAPGDAEARVQAEKLGAGWIVSGGFQRLGDQVRITARLVNVETGATRQSVKIDGAMTDVFTLQDRIVRGLAEGLKQIAGGSPAPAVSAAVSPSSASPAPATTPGAPASPRPNAPAASSASGAIVIGDNTSRLVGVAADAGTLTGRPSVRPARVQSAPAIDGRLDDEVWREAARVTQFVQVQPLDGAPATEATEVYIAYDSANVYLGFYAHYANPAIIRANRSDRDETSRDDIISVYFDTFLDQQRAYVFSVNGFGVQGDAILNSQGGGRGGGRGPGRGGGRGGGGSFGGAPGGDSSWNALFSTAGELVADGFTAEMAIPFKSLRYPQRGGGEAHRWGFQIARNIGGKNETIVWSPNSRLVSGFLPQMGVLDGLTGLSTSRNMEIQPTFTAVQFGSVNTSTGAFVNKDPSPEGGVNFKYGVTSNMTADVTYNPDFSQIESDRPQIEVNQRFALFFPELRPFFLEGSEIFTLQRVPITPVHTRTIVDPRYGAKLSGKVGNTTIGVMYADDEAPGSVEDRDDPAYGQTAQTFVGRVRRDLYAESHVGAVVTNREFLDSYSRLTGVDANFRLGRTNSLRFVALGTQHRDLAGVETTGHMIGSFTDKTGRNLSYTFGGYLISPDFKTDVGFVRRSDQQRLFTNLSYRWWPEGAIINWGPRFNYSRDYTFESIVQDEEVSAGVNFSFAKSISLFANVDRDMERFGGIDFYKTRYSIGGPVNTSRRFGFGGFFNTGDEIFYHETSPFLGRETGFDAFVNLRPISRLQSQININTSRFSDPRNGGREVFDARIFRALTTYQFSDRVLLRNISEYNTLAKTVGFNVLLTYRVNSGTALFVGFDDRYRQADLISGDLDGDGIVERPYSTSNLRRTNNAIFMKLQYLFRS